MVRARNEHREVCQEYTISALLITPAISPPTFYTFLTSFMVTAFFKFLISRPFPPNITIFYGDKKGWALRIRCWNRSGVQWRHFHQRSFLLFFRLSLPHPQTFSNSLLMPHRYNGHGNRPTSHEQIILKKRCE